MICNLAHLIEHTAQRYPEKVAFKCLDDSITYSELNLKANFLAACLLDLGVGKGDRVAIFMNRCLETAVAVYGILKSGGAFVAINPFLPLNRIQMILTDCGIKHLITTGSQSKKVSSLSKETPILQSIIGLSNEDDPKSISWESIFSKFLNGYDKPRILEPDLATILYTSGSTGTPKGIMHSHYSLLSLARLEADLHCSTNQDIIGNFAPLHFDQSLFGYFSGPLVGATTIIFPDAYIKLPKSLSVLAAKEKITIWFSVPLILTQILINGDLDNQDFSTLRWVRFGGEVFPLKQLRELMLKWPHAKFINSYGPSELARCTYYILEKPPETDKPLPLGTVWGNTEYKILDENQKEVKKGDPGELVVRSSTLMIGYWNNIKLTEQSFYRVRIANGYDHIYYRTGDLVRENKSNELMFLGRMDRQIKLRGYRIELDEIESILLQNAFVAEAAVIVVQKENAPRSLEAVVQLVEGAHIDSSALLFFCKEELPPYAVPHTLTIMKNFPRTGTGKIDRAEIIKMLEANAV